VGVFAPQQPTDLEEGATRCEWGVVLYLGNGGVYCDQEDGDFGVMNLERLYWAASLLCVFYHLRHLRFT